ncbi:MAG: MerR family DNA-binding transcriptional regulator [Bacteroidetes bacterium]|nr:MerR family DNA-binding transcriptional regulator [Bacteroidota bacterium]
MANIIGIEQDLLTDLLRSVVRQEMVELRDEIKATIISRRESLLQEERLTTNDLIQLLGVTRHTITNYQKKGLLPKPARDTSDRPYWTLDQLKVILAKKGVKTKFEV